MIFNFNRIPSDHSRWRGYLRKVLMLLGVDFYLAMDDRRFLEGRVLPYFQRCEGINRILFVGCDWYTRGYKKFFRSKQYWTMDINPGQKAFGSNLHVVDGFEHVGRHFAPDSLDLIICNGVYGYGLNDLESFDQAMRGVMSALRPGGIFILGWDNNPRRTPFSLSLSRNLSSLDKYLFPPIDCNQYISKNEGCHTYSFYIKSKGYGGNL